MSYSEITFKDKNPIKRWLQQRRLVVATKVAVYTNSPRVILDFGAGNGELCKLLAVIYPEAQLICYEPTLARMEEARANLAALKAVRFVTDVNEIESEQIDLIFCLEVFEHLPNEETRAALDQFDRLLAVNGSAILGVPIEIGLPALYKGIFRMSRRYGEFDASILNVMRATFCDPPVQRPSLEVVPGFMYHLEHMGFDYRKLQDTLKSRFKLKRVVTSPFKLLGASVNPEINFLIEKSMLLTARFEGD